MPGVPLCIVDENGRESETGAEGDIAIASQTKSGEKVMCLFEGYLGKDGKTQLNLRNDIDKNGNPGRRQWYLTGDRAYRDEDGYIWFVGRSDDVINSSGYRIGMFLISSSGSRYGSARLWYWYSPHVAGALLMILMPSS